MLYPEASAIAQYGGMSAGELRCNPPARSSHSSERGRIRCTQAAAVCYRIGRKGIEFLLVQTRNRRWTFPKGGIELGLTYAQAAALEAFEEAGVHGRIEQVSFARYVRRKPHAAANIVIHAHLCEVLRLGPPQESNRNPTWFLPEIAKRRLQEKRKTGFATELSRVVDRAVARIQRLGAANSKSIDALQKVQFEAIDDAMVYGRWLKASVSRFSRYGELRQSAAIPLAVNANLSKFLRLASSRNTRLLPERAGQRSASLSPVIDSTSRRKPQRKPDLP